MAYMAYFVRDVIAFAALIAFSATVLVWGGVLMQIS